MAKNAGFLICLLIMAMDVVAGILGIEAEIAQNKVKHLKVWVFECRDPSYQAFKLGVAACVLLALAHAIGNWMGGCVCIWSKEDLNRVTANKQLAVASLIFSWIILAVAFSMLILGALSNSKSRRTCGLAHHRLLSIGGVLCFIHGLFTVAYFVSAKAARKEDRQRQGHA
ncbi:protein DESIGUAL 2 [Syzygium oleosum]|uniref:protein DESIGUAL 2 n=1 Tax=Syzygium oleosum TaxID=219896 RepID=UPI0011D28822|nr:protein DESIGUAL 2 [Syzygium oleosum]